jgi:hypothetical protein
MKVKDLTLLEVDNIMITKLKSYTGYRSEAVYGSGIRDIFKVTTHEINELGNTDILDTLKISKRKLKLLLKKLVALGYTECIWLCDRSIDVFRCYEEKQIEKYIIKNGIILSDIGEYGKLIAYKPKKK